MDSIIQVFVCLSPAPQRPIIKVISAKCFLRNAANGVVWVNIAYVAIFKMDTEVATYYIIGSVISTVVGTAQN